ncbi:MAG: GDP-mannose 4,6-dehydratase [Vicinamibacterales bacterium]|jgi:GDP-4-dehydro-6-deoxy-D-mannose reductase
MSAPVLVTGAAGFVGSHLLELLAEDTPEIVAWQRPGTKPLVSGTGVRWVTVEMHDRNAVDAAVRDARPSAVYHLAGVPHVGDSWGHTRETFAGNVLATHHLFEGLRRAGLAPRVLMTGSATVYAPSDHALREDDIVCPNNPYGTSKLAQEMVALRAWEDDGIPGLIARAFNHVGPRQVPSFLAPSIAKQIAGIEAGRLEPVLKVGNLEPRRDIMDVRDTVRAYRAMMQSARPGVPYNVCSGRPVAVKDLLQLFIAHARVPIRVEQDPARFRPNDTPLLLGDRARLEADTGWSPQIPLDQTVEDLIGYWRSTLTGE